MENTVETLQREVDAYLAERDPRLTHAPLEKMNELAHRVVSLGDPARSLSAAELAHAEREFEPKINAALDEFLSSPLGGRLVGAELRERRSIARAYALALAVHVRDNSLAPDEISKTCRELGAVAGGLEVEDLAPQIISELARRASAKRRAETPPAMATRELPTTPEGAAELWAEVNATQRDADTARRAALAGLERLAVERARERRATQRSAEPTDPRFRYIDERKFRGICERLAGQPESALTAEELKLVNEILVDEIRAGYERHFQGKSQPSPDEFGSALKPSRGLAAALAVYWRESPDATSRRIYAAARDIGRQLAGWTGDESEAPTLPTEWVDE